jgi:hypothetical protein
LSTHITPSMMHTSPTAPRAAPGAEPRDGHVPANLGPERRHRRGACCRHPPWGLPCHRRARRKA